MRLILVPTKGVELTRDRARVRTVLATARGSASANREHAIAVREAEGFFRNDQRVIRDVIERECRSGDPMCAKDLDREAREILNEAGQHIRHLVTTLTELNTHGSDTSTRRVLSWCCRPPAGTGRTAICTSAI